MRCRQTPSQSEVLSGCSTASGKSRMARARCPSDVSLGGCCVETPTLLSGGTSVAISPLEANDLLWVTGIALNTRMAEGTGHFKIGIEFVEADPAPRTICKNFSDSWKRMAQSKRSRTRHTCADSLALKGRRRRFAHPHRRITW